jgi:glycosyltransferase involved in cell wall biosynthesis
MKKIKIAYFIDTYRPGAGTENQLKGLLRHLDPDRVDATLFTLRDEIPRKHRSGIPWPTECLGVRRLVTPGGLLKFLKLVRRLRKERYDIVMIYFLDTNLFVTPACFLGGIKNCVVNRRDMGYWHEPRLLKRLNLVNKMTGYFLVNSYAVKRLAADAEHFPSERIKVIYNGLWDVHDADEPGMVKAQLGLPDNAQIVGIIANLRPVKRVDRFIQMASMVAAKSENVHFLILGRGELEADLKKQAEKLGLSSRVQFLRQVPNVRSYLPLFDVGVLTSESEGLSNSLIEYARAGVPAVAFNVGGNREIIDNGQSGLLVPDGDIESLASGVNRILTDTEIGKRFAIAGKQLALERFAPEKIMKQLMDFYEALVKSEKKSLRFDQNLSKE